MSIVWVQEPVFDSDGRDDMFDHIRHHYGSLFRIESPKYDTDPDDFSFTAELEFSADRDDLENAEAEYRYYRYPRRTRKGRRARAAAWFKAMQEQYNIPTEVLQPLYREFRDHIFGHRSVEQFSTRNRKVTKWQDNNTR